MGKIKNYTRAEDERDLDIIACKDTGWSMSEIRAKYGVSNGYIQRLWRMAMRGATS